MSINNRLINTGGGGLEGIPFSAGSISSSVYVSEYGNYSNQGSGTTVMANDGLFAYKFASGFSQGFAYQLGTAYDGLFNNNSTYGAFYWESAYSDWRPTHGYWNEGQTVLTGIAYSGNSSVGNYIASQNAVISQGGYYNLTNRYAIGQTDPNLGGIGNFYGISFAGSGFRALVVGSDNKWNLYDVPTPYELNTPAGAWTKLQTGTIPNSATANKCWMSDDGTNVFFIDGSWVIRQYLLSTPYDMSSISSLYGSFDAANTTSPNFYVQSIVIPAIGNNFYIESYYQINPYPNPRYIMKKYSL